MGTLFRFLLACFALSVFGQAYAARAPSSLDYDSAWQCENSTKFYWYCEHEEEPIDSNEPPKKPQTPEAAALEEIENAKQELEGKKALAITKPTPENVKAYIVAQEVVMQKSAVFSDVWRRVVWQNPDINYQLKRPVNSAGLDTYNESRIEVQKQTLEKIKDEWGLFFIFRSDCPYCHKLAPILKFLNEAYGITIFPISVDGLGLPEFPNPQRDNGIVAKLNVKQVPMVVLGNVKDKRLIPVGSGVISAQEMIERIYILTSTKPGQLY